MFSFSVEIFPFFLSVRYLYDDSFRLVVNRVNKLTTFEIERKFSQDVFSHVSPFILPDPVGSFNFSNQVFSQILFFFFDSPFCSASFFLHIYSIFIHKYTYMHILSVYILYMLSSGVIILFNLYLYQFILL